MSGFDLFDVQSVFWDNKKLETTRCLKTKRIKEKSIHMGEYEIFCLNSVETPCNFKNSMKFAKQIILKPRTSRPIHKQTSLTYSSNWNTNTQNVQTLSDLVDFEGKWNELWGHKTILEWNKWITR